VPSSAIIADATRWFLAAYFVSVALFYTGRIFWYRARHGGSSPQHLGPVGSAQRRVQRTFRIFRALILVAVVVHLLRPEWDGIFGPLSLFAHPLVLLTGDGLMLLGLTLAVVGHKSLGEAWRSGIDPHAPGQLVSRGVYAISRNPMMLGVQLGQFGLFLAWPSLFTLACFVIGVTAVHLAVAQEEAHLADRFGPDYRRYCAQVPRWLALPAAKGARARATP
jgi:protein-S-isoprenylcysteine O-methyltransferase Ste14